MVFVVFVELLVIYCEVLCGDFGAEDVDVEFEFGGGRGRGKEMGGVDDVGGGGGCEGEGEGVVRELGREEGRLMGEGSGGRWVVRDTKCWFRVRPDNGRVRRVVGNVMNF